MRHAPSIAWLWIGLSAIACQNLPSIRAGICGNGVIDPGENCDSFARGEAECRPPGAQAECHLDCSLRSDGTRVACPRGFGCASDDVCRRATGVYRAQPDAIAGNAFSLLAGDFDGDHRDDIVSEEPSGMLGATRVRVHYFDRDAKLLDTIAPPLSLVALTTASFDDDGRADLVASDGSLGLLHGQPDRSLISETYPTYSLSQTAVRLIGPLLREPVDDTSALLVLAERDGMISLSRPDPNAIGLHTIAEFPGSLGELAGEPVLGHVYDDPQRYPCLDAAFALQGARELSIYSVCERAGTTDTYRWRELEQNRVPLEPSASIEHGPLFADVDGDGHLDVLLGARLDDAAAGDDDTLYVAFGDGSSLASARPFQAPLDANPPAALALPLAAGDFTGDGAADMIYPNGFLLSVLGSDRSDIGYHTATTRLGSSWSEARVADFNANGMNDVVAASSDKLDIDFFNGTGSHRLNPFVIPTSRPVGHLAVGDFDGDSITDVAFSEAAAANDGAAVAVAFGNPAGPPATPHTIARVAGITQIGPLPYGQNTTVDGMFVSYQQTDAAGFVGSALAQFAPLGERTLVCGVDLTSFASDGSLQSMPGLALTTGSFTGKDQHDVILLGSDLSAGSHEMWLVPDIKHRNGQPQRLGWSFDPSLVLFKAVESRSSMPRLALSSPLEDPPTVTLLLAAGDLDRDGVDELVTAAPDQSATHCLVTSAELAVGDSFSLALRTTLVLDETCDTASQLAVRDLDGDGAAEVVLLAASDSSSRKLSVFWNDGNGNLSAADTSVLARGELPQAFVLFRSTENAAPELAYVTDSRVHVARVSRARSFADQVLELELQSGTGITAADVDGDGVTDLAVADAGSLRILRAELEP